MDRISQFLQERIDANDFPSAVYLVAEKGEIVFQDALGHAVVEPEMIEAKIDTIYDLASLTKPLVTGLLIAKLAAEGEIDLSDLAYRYLPEFETEDKHVITLQRLLLHTSGLAAWKPFYFDAANRADILNFIADLPKDRAEDELVVYSDLNFTVLMFILERVFEKRIDEAAHAEIFVELGLKDTFFNPPAELKPRIAASEKGNEYERQTCIELGYIDPDGPEEAGTPKLRNYPIWGEVHDGNAWFMGGTAGHAGLFSTAQETFELAKQFLPSTTTVLSPESCDIFNTNFTRQMNQARSIAFQLAETPESTAGSLMPPESFGHLGFTGTSLWIDPVNERIFILLTNRTHAHPLPFVNINSVRRRFHDLAIRELDKKA
jgi:CubicO group peptidase (beta-lactamase class C family)